MQSFRIACIVSQGIRKTFFLKTAPKIEGFAAFSLKHYSPQKMESQLIVKDSSTENKTFFRDEKLPSLPLPRLEQTMDTYLDSCKAVLDAEEFEKTKSIVHKFQHTEGRHLHELLQKKAKSERNWLEKWWEDMYLEYRASLVYMNFTGFGDLTDIWPWKAGTQLERSALVLYSFTKFWVLLREEKLLQHKSGKGEPLSMHQFRNLFNTCRIPLPKHDHVYNWFKTKLEGDCPSHMIVIYNQRMYKIECINRSTGEIYTPPQFQKMLAEIKSSSDLGDGVPALTALDRDTWADGRAHLQSLSPENERNLHDIETAIMSFTMTDTYVKNGTELFCLGNGRGIPGSRWCEKSFNFISTANGALVCNCDHTPFDGMVFVLLIMHKAALLFDMRGKWNGPMTTEKTAPVVEIQFKLDDKMRSWIRQGENIERKFQDEVDLLMITNTDIGKSALKSKKIHPEAFVQICIQLAYMRKHGKQAPTYETATTRAFYHGRTETCRTCTPEVVEFCKAVIKDSPNKGSLFYKAYEKYMWLVKECRSAQGCDRHLFGLALTAAENGQEMPELFKDPAFIKSGGNGNFTLSTSCAGYSMCIGAVAPMTEDGYGVFYRINNDKISFVITSWNACPETETNSIADHIIKAMNDVWALIAEESAKL